MNDENDSAMLRARLEARHQESYRRVEVITGERRRRDWSPEEKDEILLACAEPGVNISAVARRYGVNRGLLNKWRKAAGLPIGRRGGRGLDVPVFVPVTISDEVVASQSADNRSDVDAGRIEIELGGGRIVMSGNVTPELAQAVVSALRGKR